MNTDPTPLNCESVHLFPDGSRRRCLSNMKLRTWVNPSGERLTLCVDHHFQVQTPASVWTPLEVRSAGE